MSLKYFPVIFLAACILSACSPRLSPFTQRMYEEFHWSDSELRQIQFYLSEDIMMRRQLSGSKSEIVAGEIVVIDGRQVEQILIPEGTPGVFLFSPKTNRFAVSFEEGSDRRFLMFGPNPKANDRYVLLASDWDRRRGKVTYDGRRYEVDANSAFAGLMVDLKKIRKVSVDARRAGGRKVDYR